MTAFDVARTQAQLCTTSQQLRQLIAGCDFTWFTHCNSLYPDIRPKGFNEGILCPVLDDAWERKLQDGKSYIEYDVWQQMFHDWEHDQFDCPSALFKWKFEDEQAKLVKFNGHSIECLMDDEEDIEEDTLREAFIVKVMCDEMFKHENIQADLDHRVAWERMNWEESLRDQSND